VSFVTFVSIYSCSQDMRSVIGASGHSHLQQLLVLPGLRQEGSQAKGVPSETLLLRDLLKIDGESTAVLCPFVVLKLRFLSS